MRRSPVALLLFSLICSAAAAESGTGSRFTYIAWNAPALMSLLPTDFIGRSILPTAICNQEAGLALALGLYESGQSLEGRLSIGPSNRSYLAVQGQIGWNWFFAESLWDMDRGPYAGTELRYWDLIQLHSGVQSHNLAPMLDLGWCFDFGIWFVDLRFSQVFAIASYSSIPHAIPGFQFLFSPLPGISPWLPIGLVQVGIKL
jgi:hypothetical protein